MCLIIFEEKAEIQDQNPLSLNPVQKADDPIQDRNRKMLANVFIMFSFSGVVVLQAGLQGSLSSNGRFYLWKTNYNGFKILFQAIENLLSQVIQGAKNISNDTLEIVIDILELLEHLSKKCRKRMSSHILMMRQFCLALVDKFVHVPNPPIHLLAGCLR